MSNYSSTALHPRTGKWEKVEMLDDHYGRHEYGVRFPNGDIFKESEVTVEDGRLPDDPQEPHNGKHDAPKLERTSITYDIQHVITCASASHEEPHICTNREIKAQVTVHLPSGAVTLKKVDAPRNRYGDNNNAWVFQNSDPELVRAVGEMLIAAANVSRNVKNDNV